MKNIFWAASAKKTQTFEHVKKTITEKWQDEQLRPKTDPNTSERIHYGRIISIPWL